MRKVYKDKKSRRFFLARMRYAAKRQTSKWKNRKKHRKLGARIIKRKRRRQARKPYLGIKAPQNFSLIHNTEEVLEYFSFAEENLRKGSNVLFDISKVENLTPDTIALLVASINDVDFLHGSLFMGNAPEKPELNKLFTQSGFYEHVRARGYFIPTKENLLHKEVHHKVVTDVAKSAAIKGIKHIFGNENPYDPLYEILIECMSNTNNHANLHTKGKCNWWLYVYDDPKQAITSYSFIDLGVGIFKSVIVQNYLKNFLKGTPLYKNINLVDDLLKGKIQSRIEKDNEIRGKGIPQIVGHSASPHFRSFYIITNDVKINLKTGERKELPYDLKGTLLYWELQS